MKYWLIKSEPSAFSIDDLVKSPRKTTCWDGVRNYQARNFMRNEIKKGDLALFYHSSCKQTGVVGVVEVVKESYVDHTAFDKKDKHYDAKSDPDNPRWFMVDVKLKKKLSRTIELKELRAFTDTKLKDLLLLRRGNRLSITPVKKSDFDFILSLE